MSTPQQDKPWDFSHVLNLVNALSSPVLTDRDHRSIHVSAETAHISNNDYTHGVDSKDFAPSPAANLGDFGKIWHFLGIQSSQDCADNRGNNVIANAEASVLNAFASKADYTSDGAIRYGSRAKGSKKVTWKEETSADEPLPDSASERSPTPSLEEPKLTKSQRKKQNRRQRKAKELLAGQGTVSESEADSFWSGTPARKASTHAVSAQPAHRYNLRSGKGLRSPALDSPLANTVANGTSGENSNPAQPNGHLVIASTGSPMPTRPDASMRQTSQPLTTSQGTIPPESNRNVDTTPRWPVAMSKSSSNTRLIPATVSPRIVTPRGRSDMQQHPPASATKAVLAVQAAQAGLQGVKPLANLSNRQTAIEPKIVRTGEDRHWALFLKLIDEFSDDRKHLIAPMNLTTHNNDDKGIHVFVDASNIFIGFNDQLKRSRGIPLTARVPPVSLSFDGLALLMERRRPVAKRVLAGSMPHLPAFDKAKAVGYECNILEKVYKARELTERQVYFRDVDRRHYGRVKAPYSTHGNAGLPSTSPPQDYLSGSEDRVGTASDSGTTTTRPQYAPPRMIEQGVDEILHLKIAHSVMDYQSPATMVLATGDAAQAEYSDGFMAMVQRALVKGWKVELVSWSKNISSMYLRPSFRQTWGDNFRVILLDDYAEELLDL